MMESEKSLGQPTATLKLTPDVRAELETMGFNAGIQWSAQMLRELAEREDPESCARTTLEETASTLSLCVRIQ